MIEVNNVEDVLTFALVAKSGSFAQAGKKLGLTRSAVGKRIARLEKSLDVRLIQRTTRKLSLTDEGKVFLQHCELVVEQIEQAYQVLQQRKGTPTGKLRITAPIVLGASFLNQIINQYLTLYPQVEVEVSYTDSLLDLVSEGFDLGIRIGDTVANNQLWARYLGEYALVAVATPRYLASSTKIKEVADLAQQQLLVFYNFNFIDLPWHFRQEGKLVSFHPREAQTMQRANNAQLLLDLCLADKGILYMPWFYVASYLKSGELVQVLPEYELFSTPMRAVYPSKSNLSPKVRAFIDLLVNSVSFQQLQQH
ncbi:LysR family transcriptional regulator [Psittacicella gerlachiana]|uniref:HTH lysR-type domain-containing protein n=1 Tax=Psittacicella gerlachiana TaxID=2028574 RepID=A0A3A1YFU0_9GAMM|nr:LysR family transcriptional regulator [Psittacicella gerlachiana]RIY36421.1 hypothetical protein CKF59_02810 [Psittacicella gerlachiana]